ncbi:MAG: DUF2849 domain-containing protein, partial [Azospirillaceae bacterium]
HRSRTMAEQHRRVVEGLPKIVTANHLRGGDVVYLRSDRSWTAALAEAALWEGEAVEDGLDIGRTAETDRAVVGVYALDVVVDDAGRRHPRTWRERIRAAGPSVPYGTAALAALQGS